MGGGIIEAVGEGVSSERVGDGVGVYQAQYGRRFGTAAELVAVGDERAPLLPEGVTHEEGACLGIPVMTAHRCVFADGSVAGQTLLITGGAGRVGHYVIQWAHHAGARVIATASNDDDKKACTEAGADAVVNHREEDWSIGVLAANDGQPLDRVIEVEFGANLAEVLKLVRTGATIATYSSTQVPQPKLPFYQNDVSGSEDPARHRLRDARRSKTAGHRRYRRGVRAREGSSTEWRTCWGWTRSQRRMH